MMHIAKAWRAGPLIAVAAFALLDSRDARANSYNLQVESVTDYGTGDQLTNAIPNGQGFIDTMTPPGLFVARPYYTNGNVWDTDFMDPDITHNSAAFVVT